MDYLNMLMIRTLSLHFAVYLDCGGFAELLCYYYLYGQVLMFLKIKFKRV